MSKRSKIKGRKVRIPISSPAVIHKTERTAVADLSSWINDLIKEQGFPLGNSEVETSGPDTKFPDIILFTAPRSDRVLVSGEFKPPYYDPFDENDLKHPARKKAIQRQAPYFITSNFKRLVWFSTEAVTRMETEEKQIIAVYDLAPTLENLDFLRETRFESTTRRELEAFLNDLVRIHFKREVAPRLPLDQLLVLRLRTLIDLLATRYHHVVANRAHKDQKFEERLALWFEQQQWSYRREESDYARAARQAAYLLANKILFYQVLQSHRPRDLDRLSIPEDLTRGGVLRSILQGFFDDVVKNIDYETIYSSDFIDDIAFPDDSEVVRIVRSLNDLLARYDVGSLGYDILGPIFERLIPPDERHVLGQYFTNANVVDLILYHAIRNEKDVVLDPACGAGTFLVRGYQRKRLLNPRLSHAKILAGLWGIDIAKFPAHLCTINLAINDLSQKENYPRVLQQDFFEISQKKDKRRKKVERSIEIRHFTGEVSRILFPVKVDAIVGNPPYTRQEEIDEIASSGGYKRHLIQQALRDAPSGVVDISDRAGIHAYFFIHGSKLLPPDGRFGFVVSDTWLDADFGTGLKSFLLSTFRISFIIASKIERWFADASINTCIVLLEREPDEGKRKQSVTRFVLLKRPLKELIAAGGGKAEERERAESIEKLFDLFQGHNKRYENEDAHIVPVLHDDLQPEDKWGLHLRAPSVFLETLEANESRIIPLSKISVVLYGVKSGADPWFYVKDVTSTFPGEKEKRARRLGYRGKADCLRLIESGDGTHWPVEKDFLVPIVRNPESYRSIKLESKAIPDLAVVVPPVDKRKLRGKMILRYIAHGERKTYKMGKGRDLVPARTNSCASRRYWYTLPDIPKAQILWQRASDIRIRHYFSEVPVLARERFYPIIPKPGVDEAYLAGFLNSAFVAVWLEVQRAALGEGAIEATVEEVKGLPVIDPRSLPKKVVQEVGNAVKKLGSRDIGTVFEEYGANEPQVVSWDRIPDDRKQLEEVILGRVLGLSAKSQLELLRALVDLTRARIDRAGSVQTTNNAERAAMREFAQRVVREVSVE